MTLPEALAAQPLHKATQRLRWFVRAFEEQAEKTEAETGNRFDIDHGALATVFADWLRSFEVQKPTQPDDDLAYVGFAAGLMLRSLIALEPAALVARPEHADLSNPAYFWPEGYLYVAFCLNVRGLVLDHDFHHRQQVSPLVHETRTWWSFRENVAEDPELAIAFLDLFAGEEPEWTMPQIFRSGRVREIASRLDLPSHPDHG